LTGNRECGEAEFQICGAEKRKARDPNDRLRRGINSYDENIMSVKTPWADDAARDQ